MARYTMTVGGKPLTARESFEVRNPATGLVCGQAPDCSPDTLDLAVAAARAAGPGWRSDPAARRAALAEVGRVLRDRADELIPVLTMEQGKPLRDAKAEIGRAAQRFEYFAGLDVPVELVGESGGFRTEVRRRALGPVAAITPWNFPVQLAAAKVAPALAAGNPVVLKPSPFTPLTTLEFGRLLAKVLPPGVLNVVSGRDPLGERLVTHPGDQLHRLGGHRPEGGRGRRAGAETADPGTGRQRRGDRAAGRRGGPDRRCAVLVGFRQLRPDLHGGQTGLRAPRALRRGGGLAGTKSSGLGTSGGMWGIYGHSEPFVLHRPVS